MNIEMSYQEACAIVKAGGYDGFMAYIVDNYPKVKNFNFYNMSTAWFEEGKQFICKIKGAKGDVLISWL